VSVETAVVVPAPEFAVTGAVHVPFAATPTMRFEAAVTEPEGVEVQSIALTARLSERMDAESCLDCSAAISESWTTRRLACCSVWWRSAMPPPCTSST